jgi:putative SOS response-associated peptidase YedK
MVRDTQHDRDEGWDSLTTVISTDANELHPLIHPRMPVILPGYAFAISCNKSKAKFD